MTRSGDDMRGTIGAEILNGWHINSNKPLDDFVIPTELKLDPATADLVSAEYPAHVLRTFTFSGTSKLAVYEGRIQINFVARLKNGAKEIRGRLHYQACNDKVCLPPRDLALVVSVAAPASGAVTPAAESGRRYTDFTPLSQA